MIVTNNQFKLRDIRPRKYNQLFSLLQYLIAGTSVNKVLFEDMSSSEWEELFQLTSDQGVMAITLEGIKNSDLKPNDMVLIKWFGYANIIENKYKQHLSLARELTDYWAQKGIRTMVFKGLALCQYYPNPAQREFGDFDCYLFNDKNDAFEAGNIAAKEIGASVDDSWYKHSKISYKELTVENHHFFTAARKGKTERRLNKQLVDILGDGSPLARLDNTNIFLPHVEFEGLFYLYHALNHFLVEGINLRHFCDWAFWLKANQSKINWNSFYAQCKEYKYERFVNVLNEIAIKYFGLKISNPEIIQKLGETANIELLADRVIDNTLFVDSKIYNKGKSVWSQRLSVITNAFKYSWKYREVAQYSLISYLWSYVYGFIVRDEDD